SLIAAVLPASQPRNRGRRLLNLPRTRMRQSRQEGPSQERARAATRIRVLRPNPFWDGMSYAIPGITHTDLTPPLSFVRRSISFKRFGSTSQRSSMPPGQRGGVFAYLRSTPRVLSGIHACRSLKPGSYDRASIAPLTLVSCVG